jgi:replicative DNA helicase
MSPRAQQQPEREPRRSPPWSEDAEQAVLAACLIDARVIGQAIQFIEPSMFFAEKHVRIFRAMMTCHETGRVIDPVTLADVLTQHGTLTAAGGKDYIGFLVDAVPTAANVEYHAMIVREKSQLRRVIDCATSISADAYAQSESAKTLAQAMFTELLPCTVDDETAEGFLPLSASLFPTMEAIEARAAGGMGGGIITGYSAIDRETGGLRPGELIIIGGAEKMGKSAAALNIALRIAMRAIDDGGGEVGYVSAEMTRTTMTERCLAWASRVDGRKINTGRLDAADFEALGKAAGVLARVPLYIDDEAEPSLSDIVARCTALKAAHPHLRAIVVDFLQLIHAHEKGIPENVELKRIAYGLKHMAKRLNVVVFAPCQVNTKDVEETKEPRPRLKDLQGSSGMRQAADFIVLLYRPGVYSPSSDPSVIEFDFAGSRRTAPFKLKLSWDGPTQYISNPPTPAPAPTQLKLLRDDA